MTLHEYPAVEQGSDEWHALRRGILTASTVGRVVTAKTLKPASNEESRGLTALLVAERITGWTDPTYTNADMLRGTMSEPVARDLYAEHFATEITEVGFVVRREDTWTLGFSPDGLVGADGLLEIKAPRAKTHVTTILADAVPTYHLAQCQAGLLVSGRKWLDFVSYTSGLPLFVKRVYPDPQWFEAITAACIQFEKNAAELHAQYEARVVGMPTTERIDFDLEIAI